MIAQPKLFTPEPTEKFKAWREFTAATCRYNWRLWPTRERPPHERIVRCRREREAAKKLRPAIALPTQRQGSLL